MSPRRLLSIAGAVAGLAAVVAAWVVFAPMQVGGSTAFTMIVGTSMEPHLHRGDLVLVRRASGYRVGDVVAYRSSALHRNVLHRIVGERGGRWVFQGDNNDFVDPGTVSTDDLIGRYWFKIGGGATVLQWVKTPSHAALIAGGAGLALLGGGAGTGTRRRRRRGGGERGRPRELPPSPVALPWSSIAAAAAVALIVFLALGAASVALPATRQVPTPRLYSERGTFSYGAPAPRGAAYPSGRVRSGDAVFTALVDRLAVRFDWRLETAQPHAVHGTATLAAVVTDGGGWSRRLVLRKPRPFAGDRTRLAGTLHLDRLRALLEQFEAATGTTRSAYSVSIVPQIALSGSVAGQTVRDRFAPALQLTLDDERLQLATPGDPADPNGLVRGKDVGGTTSAPNRLELMRLHVPLPAAKAVAGGGAALSLLVLLAALGALRAGRGEAELARIRSRYAGWIVRVVAEPPADRTVEVSDFEQLARLAERYERLILHCEQSGSFTVVDDGVAYRWRCGSGPAAAPARGGEVPSGLARLQDIVEQASRRPPVERRDWSTRPWSGRPDEPHDGRREASGR